MITRHISRFYERHTGMAVLGTFLSAIFILSSFIVFNVVTDRQAIASETSHQAEAARDTNKVVIYDKDGNPITFQADYKVSEYAPGFKTSLVCRNENGKELVNEFLPMGGYFKNATTWVQGINNKGNRFWLWPMGALTCIEEELRD